MCAPPGVCTLTWWVSLRSLQNSRIPRLSVSSEVVVLVSAVQLLVRRFCPLGTFPTPSVDYVPGPWRMRFMGSHPMMFRWCSDAPRQWCTSTPVPKPNDVRRARNEAPERIRVYYDTTAGDWTMLIFTGWRKVASKVTWVTLVCTSIDYNVKSGALGPKKSYEMTGNCRSSWGRERGGRYAARCLARSKYMQNYSFLELLPDIIMFSICSARPEWLLQL